MPVIQNKHHLLPLSWLYFLLLSSYQCQEDHKVMGIPSIKDKEKCFCFFKDANNWWILWHISRLLKLGNILSHCHTYKQETYTKKEAAKTNNLNGSYLEFCFLQKQVTKMFLCDGNNKIDDAIIWIYKLGEHLTVKNRDWKIRYFQCVH